jgi:hypothetical protein
MGVEKGSGAAAGVNNSSARGPFCWRARRTSRNRKIERPSSTVADPPGMASEGIRRLIMPLPFARRPQNAIESCCFGSS